MDNKIDRLCRAFFCVSSPSSCEEKNSGSNLLVNNRVGFFLLKVEITAIAQDELIVNNPSKIFFYKFSLYS